MHKVVFFVVQVINLSNSFEIPLVSDLCSRTRNGKLVSRIRETGSGTVEVYVCTLKQGILRMEVHNPLITCRNDLNSSRSGCLGKNSKWYDQFNAICTNAGEKTVFLQTCGGKGEQCCHAKNCVIEIYDKVHFKLPSNQNALRNILGKTVFMKNGIVPLINRKMSFIRSFLKPFLGRKRELQISAYKNPSRDDEYYRSQDKRSIMCILSDCFPLEFFWANRDMQPSGNILDCVLWKYFARAIPRKATVMVSLLVLFQKRILSQVFSWTTF